MLSHSQAPARAKPLGLAFITAILICVVLNPLNSSTLSVALPVLLHALHTSPSGITWIISGYYLGSAVSQPVMGKLGDAWGRARFVYVGLAVMIATALLAPLSQSLDSFVIWRVIQALGTSMIYPNAIGLIREHRSQDVGKILGWIGMASGTAVAVGPTVGGFLIDLASWHAIFWLNIPLAVIAIGLLLWVLPKYSSVSHLHDIKKQTANRIEKRLDRIDWAGILLFTAAMTSWLLWFNTKHRFVSHGVLDLVLGLLFTTALVAAELRHTAPVLPIRWFYRPQFSLSSVIAVLSNLVMYCILYGLPIFLETVRRFSATQSGLVLLAFAGVMSLASPWGGRFAQGKTRRFPLLLAGGFLVLGTLVLCWVNVLNMGELIVGLALIGMSFAISNVVIQQIVLESAPKQETGQASGVYTLLRYVGTMLSSVFVGSSISTASGAQTLFVLLTGASLLTAALTLGLRDTLRQKSI
ncbi:MFS transporter [Alicyclobacillus tolerans]|uniref:MFS transporter n=1 Tax=Alicyclobacillus tolerans TaxID=90970 RepID=UPI001F458CFF|nr:MFS transporter [Alicyclobacillus tolerans]MCF8563617.1 MFS transporter [Alicyclobacillus tolerans]